MASASIREPKPCYLSPITEPLAKARNIHVTRNDLVYLNENLTDLIQVSGNDYTGIPGVFHHLHCLNNLRKTMHWDYYEPLMVKYTHPESLSKGHSGMRLND